MKINDIDWSKVPDILAKEQVLARAIAANEQRSII